MDTAISAAIAAARAAYADFGAKLEAIEALLAAPAVVVDPPPVVVKPQQPAGFKLTVQGDGSLLITGVPTVTWSMVKNSEAERWPWYGVRHDDVAVPAGGLVIPAQPISSDGDFVKVLYAKPDGSIGAEDGPKTWKAPAKPSIAVPATPAGGLAMAQAFQRRSVFNINWERERFARFSFDATVRDNYKDVGIGGIRGFIPWRPGGDVYEGKRVQFWDLDLEKAPNKEQFNRFKPNAKAITNAGLILELDLLDEVPLGSFNDSRLPVVKQYLKDACAWIKEWQIDPALLCIGPVNEYRGEDNPTWEPLRFTFDAILQAELGERYLLGMAPAYWGHWKSYISTEHGKYNPGPNLQRVHFWHAYDRNSAAGWVGVQAGINTWSKANGGRVVMCGEVGPGGLNDGKDFAAGDGGWVEHINRQNPALAESVPALWACTDGDWTMNRGFSDARLWVKDKGWEPEIEKAVRQAVIANRKVRGL